MGFAISARTAENRTRWKGNVTSSSVVPRRPSKVIRYNSPCSAYSRFGNYTTDFMVHIIGITMSEYIGPAHCLCTIPIQLHVLNIQTNKSGQCV